MSSPRSATEFPGTSSAGTATATSLSIVLEGTTVGSSDVDQIGEDDVFTPGKGGASVPVSEDWAGKGVGHGNILGEECETRPVEEADAMRDDVLVNLLLAI